MQDARTPGTLTTVFYYPRSDPRLRLFALWYFALLITAWWVAGILYLGFEQSWLDFAVAAGTTIALQFLLLSVHSWRQGQRPAYRGGIVPFLNFLLPAYPPGIAIAMLLYPNERLMPLVFAAAVAICSKGIFRAPVPHGTQHFFNPSNLGITAVLFLFPWVGLAPPYHFTENISGVWDWVVPGVIMLSGIVVHAIATGRLPLILAWLGGFVLQAIARGQVFDTSVLPMLAPMTSVGFLLFTLYMIPDPATTPIKPRGQVLFGLAVAAVYAGVQVTHILFGLVLSLTIVCGLRGLGLYLLAAAFAPEPAAQEA